MKKITRTRQLCMAFLCVIALASTCLALAFKSGGEIKAAAESSLVYALDFGDSENYAKNSSETSLSDATITDNGGVSYTQNAPKGKTALNLVSGGLRQNYVSLPIEAFNSESATVAGWFKVSSNLPGWSRMFEVFGDGGNRLSVMPMAANYYNGVHMNTVINNTLITGLNGADNMLFKGGNNCQRNMPADGAALPLYDGWVHYAYEFTPTEFRYYQNGKLTHTVSGDFTASNFVKEGGEILLGATRVDGTNDFTGSYSDLRIYNTALDETQLKNEFALTYADFLTLSYDFEDGTKDSVRGYDGTLKGNAKVEPAYGRKNNVLYLDGSDADNVEAANRSSMEIPVKSINGHTAITVSVDVYVDSTGSNYARIFDFSPVQAQALMLGAKWGGSATNVFKFTKQEGLFDKMISIDTDFNKWVNLTVVADGTTAQLYVDGILCANSDNFEYNNGIFWENIGNMSFGKTFFWGDRALKGAIDNIEIYATALTETEVLLKSGITTIADDGEAVAQEKEKLELSWDGTSAKIDLTMVMGEGVRVQWATSNADVITADGTVLFPSENTSVTLTATLIRGKTKDTKQFIMEVKPAKVQDPSIVFGTDYDEVFFNENSYYEALMETNLDYMMGLDKDKLLYNYRRIAGLDTKGVQGYGAWIKDSGAGQFEAHYVVALAKASMSMPNYSYKGETVLDRLTYMVKALKECQDAYGKLYPQEKGYLGAISADQYTALEEGRNTDNTGVGIWVPWYFNHKNLEAELDVYHYAASEELREIAYEMMSAHADWCYNRMSKLDDATRLKVLRTEYGGMAEVLFQIYAETNNVNHYKSAKYFEESSLLNNIYNNVDILKGLHANTAIPKFLGCAAAYEVTGDEYYKTIVENVFEMILGRTYAFGGTSRAEHWLDDPGELKTANDSAETCCSYNMIKLADYLYRWTGDKKYLDYIDLTYTNHILASMAPDSGLKTYLTNTAFGSYKVLHTVDNSFWCCACTGMESFAKLNYGIYYKTENALTVNMFYPSEFKFNENVTLVQENDFFTTEKASFKVKGNGEFTLRLRKPDYATSTTIKINGQTVSVDETNGFYEITRNWADGDNIVYEIPFTYQLVKLNNNSNEYAIKYGPLVFVADLGSDDVNDVVGSQLEFGTAYVGDIDSKIVLAGNTLEESATLTYGENGEIYLTINTLNQGELLFRPFNQLFHKRYGMYFAYYDTLEECQEEYSVSGNELNLPFTSQSDLALMTEYSTSGATATVDTNGLLSPLGEYKLMAGLSLTSGYTVDITMYPNAKDGIINGGVYVLATNAKAGQDNINAYNIHVMKDAGASAYTVYIYKFNGTYQGALDSRSYTLKADGKVNLHVLVKDGKISVFVDGRKTAAMKIDVDTSFITESVTDVGIRAQQAEMRFADFKVISPEIRVFTNVLENLVNKATQLDGSKYTSATYEIVERALDVAKEVLKLDEMTQEQVNMAVSMLSSALDGLKEKVDATKIKNLLAVIKALDLRKFTKASVNSLNGVIADVEESDLDDISLEEYEESLNKLVDAIASLEIDKDYNPDSDSGSGSSESGNDCTSSGCRSTVDGNCVLALALCLVAVYALAKKRRQNVK